MASQLKGMACRYIPTHLMLVQLLVAIYTLDASTVAMAIYTLDASTVASGYMHT